MTERVPLDWDGARARLKAAQERLDAIDQAVGDFETVLRARDAAIARAYAESTPAGVADLVVFRVGDERFGIDALEVSEVIEIAQLTALPGVAAFYRGLLTHRGVVFPLIDIRPLVSDAFSPGATFERALLFLSDDAAAAVGADEIDALTRVETASIEPVVRADGSSAPALRGVTADGVRVLDVGVLLADARLVVDDRDVAADGAEN